MTKPGGHSKRKGRNQVSEWTWTWTWSAVPSANRQLQRERRARELQAIRRERLSRRRAETQDDLDPPHADSA